MSESGAKDKFRDGLKVSPEELYKAMGIKPNTGEVGENEIPRFVNKGYQGKRPKHKDNIIDFREIYGDKVIYRPKSTKSPKKLSGKIKALILAGSLVIGAGIYIGSQGKDEPITSSQKISVLGETPETMGISNEMYSRFQNVKEKSKNKNISNTDLIEMAPEIHDICIDITENKLANALGVDVSNISLSRESGDEGTTREVVTVNRGMNKQRYLTHEFGLSKYTISKEIAGEIKDIKKLEEIMLDIQNNSFNRDGVLSDYKVIIDDADKFVAMDLAIDENENIKTYVIKNSELSKVAEERGYTQKTTQQVEESFNTPEDIYSVNANGNVNNGDTINLRVDDDGR